MNKIILFLIIIIIGAALTSDVYLAPAPVKPLAQAPVKPLKQAPVKPQKQAPVKPQKITKNDFDCTLKAIKVCGSDDSHSTNSCLRRYMKKCEKNVPQPVPKNTSTEIKKKNHHAFKTTIVVKHKHDVERKRICITGSDKTRKCYRFDCQDAGVERCNEKVDIKCGLKFSDSRADRKACIKKSLAACLRHEKSTCKRAKRINTFRKECTAEAKTLCSGFDNKEDRCKCVGTNRHSCLIKKVDTYRRNVRKFFGCKEGSKIICSEKCGSAEKQCIEQESFVCEPVCQREARVKCNNQLNGPCFVEQKKICTQKWKTTFCEKRATIKCGKNQDCLDKQLQVCRGNLPGCMTGDVSCNDNNKCTQDICDPKKGCINKPLNCDDNNACTTEHCDPVLGCVYKTKSCDDGLTCTRDSCNTQTGACVNKFDKTICHVCGGGPCQLDSDCKAWSKSQSLSSKCLVAYCDSKTGSCMSKKKANCAEECQSSCLPLHACDKAQCVLSKKTNEFECVHSAKSCNDHKSCTIDTCDKRLGCVHTLDRETCKDSPICDVDNDCITWALSKNFDNKCKKAVCNKKKGICEAAISTKDCMMSECQKNCKTRHACENVKCVATGDDVARCLRTPVICDDKRQCTVDRCDEKLGCTFKYTINQVCKPGAQCKHNDDCKTYEKLNNLKKQCQKAVCDLALGACIKVPADKACRERRKECKETCVQKNACDVAKCVKDGDDLVCKHSKRTCDDGIECTKDSCDPVQGCVHTYVITEKCQVDAQCKIDTDCIKFGFSKKLGKKCQKAICDRQLGACVAVPKQKVCTSLDQCQFDCVAKSACQKATCVKGNKGDYVCRHTNKMTCDDGDACTFDACDPSTGKCTHTPIKSKKCKTTPPPPPPPKKECPNCKPRHACETANCVDGACTFAKRKCDDKRSCTLDSCDKQRGCVHTYVQSKECPADAQCKVTDDCAAYAKIRKLKSRCLTAVCDETRGRCVAKKSTTDTTCVPKDECIDCKPRSPCETAVCEKDLDSNVSCKRTKNTCNDGKECTKDSCDIKTGKCHNKYTISEKCTTGGQCAKNLDCQAWAIKNGHDLQCLTPVCDEVLGSCKVVPNGLECKSTTCEKQCPTNDKCKRSTCKFDTVSKQLVCQFKTRVCDDKNRCTADSCDSVKGCVHTFDKSKKGCNTPICKIKSDCAKWATDNKLADDCQDAVCDDETKTCRAVLINNKNCNPCLKDCKKTCVAANKCETTECLADPTTLKCRCVRKPLSCDDKNPCTTDVCDKVKGCQFTYTKNNDQCTEFCKSDFDCSEYGLRKELDLDCKIPVCDKATSSCKAIDNPNKTCKPIRKECNLICKAKTPCETVRCERKPSPKNNEFKCVHKTVTCNDNKKCTVDSCHPTKGCQFTFKPDNKVCIKPCEKDLDCATIEISENLAKRCLKAVCDKETGSCKRIKGPDRADCGDQCNLSDDCPQSTHGSVCCIENGKKSCCENECGYDLDCKCAEGQWGYCTKAENGRRRCKCKDKCKKNMDCDDKNPCTRDVCLKDYGFCKNIPRCVDNSLCTLDICIPSSDLKSYTCKNPTRSCTNQKDLLDKDFEKLSPSDKTKWLGLCSHTEGCKDCVVSAQCDDNNGCTKDDCINQFCISTPIDNKWCDPKIQGQAITVQAYFPTFQRL